MCLTPKTTNTCFFEKGHAKNQKKKKAPARQTWGILSELFFTKIHTFEDFFVQLSFREIFKAKKVASKLLNTFSVTTFTFSFKKDWFYEDLPKNPKIKKSKYK